MTTVDCSATIKKSDFTSHAWSTGILSTVIPFIGPALTPLVPEVKNMQDQLTSAKSDLTDATNQWSATVTKLLGEEVDLVTNFVTLLIGNNGDGTGYIDTAVTYATQPLTEKMTLLTINFTFLAIMFGIVVYYLTRRQ
jgi:t-SNARE complex subunit (syntaxin)